MNVSEVISGYLGAAGIHCVYGYPGDPNIELLEALRANRIEFVLARREGTAALMAEAYGMITGRPGIPWGRAHRTWSTASPTPIWTGCR